MAPADVQVALVTGCTPGGIGFHVAKSLHKKGYRVFATTRKGDTIKGLEGCDILNLDVNDAASLEKAAVEVRERAGTVDILVNNSGHGGGLSPLLDIDIEEQKRVFETNVWGLLRVTQTFVPLMLDGGLPPPGRKRIVNIGSVVGIRAMPWNAIYCASKHAVRGLSDSLRLELANLNVSVTLVAPGLIGTNFGQNSNSVKGDLPAGSFYRTCWEAVQRGNTGTTGKGTDVEVFADKLVGAVTARTPPKNWIAGESAWLFEWVIPYAPTWLTDRLVGSRLGVTAVEYPTTA